MKKKLTYLILFGGVILSLQACFRTVPSELSNYGLEKPFISLENREKAVGLSQKFPDDPFYGNETEVLVEFYREGDEPKKSRSKRSSDKNKKDEKELDPQLKTELKAKVTYYHSILSIDDFSHFYDNVYYNDMMKVSPIYACYNAFQDDPKWLKKYAFSSSYEVDGLFYTDARVKSWNSKIPARATELHYTYTVTYENINYLTNLFFLDNMPTGKKNIVFKVPDWMEINVLERNLENFSVTKNTKRLRNSKILEFRDYLNMEDDDDEEEETGGRRKRKKRVKYTYMQYEAANLPAYPSERMSPGPTHNQPHLLLAIKKFTNGDGKEVNVLSSLSDLYGWYHSLVKTVENDTTAVKEKALSLVEGITDDKERVKKLFYWVQDNVRYIAYEDGVAGFKPEACQSVFENRYGDCKGMANLLAQMLKSLGYDARLTWIGTRRIAYDYSTPSLAVDNHMICTLILDGKRYFLDPTEDFIEFGDYAHRIQGRQVLIENGDTFILDSIPNLSFERNKNEKIEKFTLDGHDLVGSVHDTYTGESKTRLLRYYNGLKSDRRATALERFLNDENINLKVSGIKHSTFSERAENIEFDYQLRVKNQVLTENKDWLIKLDWEGDYARMEIDSNRIADVDLGSKVYQTTIRTLILPSSASLFYVPQKVDIKNDDFRVLMEYSLKGTTLTYTKTIIFYNGTIPVENREKWNEAHEAMTKFYTDYVVLNRR